MNEKDAAWFRPMWRRVLITGILVAWLGYETIFSHETMWIVISGAGLAYCVWNFFLKFPKTPEDTPKS